VTAESTEPSTGADETLTEQPLPDEAAPGPQSTAAPAAPADPAQAPVGEPEDEATRLARELGERTADLQRLQAEYLNYKRRVDRDRTAAREQATAATLASLLPVLDDLDRARQHGELTGGFKSVAESLERTIEGLGLERFGTAGEEFDPRVHEALLSDYSAEVSVTTAATILQPGYRIGDRIVRPARVAVAEPSGEAAPAEPPAEHASAETPMATTTVDAEQD
jgi:molecular chaperone GrpE